MSAPAVLLSLLEPFVQCFTVPGFAHFRHFMLAHAGLWGPAHCVSETLRLTRWHEARHWTAPYRWMRQGRWSCTRVSQCLLDRIAGTLPVGEELILAIDDTLVKKCGSKFFGLGHYPDPTDKNPGAHRRRVRGHPWVVLALLWQHGPARWFCFPLSARLFIPDRPGETGRPFAGKIELAVQLIERLTWHGRRAIVVVDNLYAKGWLLTQALEPRDWTMISRLRSNAALYDPPPPRRPKQRGRPRKRGQKRSARHLWTRRKSGRRKLTIQIYGKSVTLDAWVGVMIPSRTLSDRPILVVITQQRSGAKMNVFFSTDTDMDPCRLLELYAARFKIEETFRELKTHGGMGDYRQRSLRAMKRHVTLCLTAQSLLRLMSLRLSGAETLAAEPWWAPQGPPSATRIRRALGAAPEISGGLSPTAKGIEIRREIHPPPQNPDPFTATAA